MNPKVGRVRPGEPARSIAQPLFARLSETLRPTFVRFMVDAHGLETVGASHEPAQPGSAILRVELETIRQVLDCGDGVSGVAALVGGESRKQSLQPRPKPKR